MPWGRDDSSSCLWWIECSHRMFHCIAVPAIEANEPYRRILSQHRGGSQQILQRTCILTPLLTPILLYKRLHIASCRFCSPRSLLGLFRASKNSSMFRWEILCLMTFPSGSDFESLGWVGRILLKWHCRPKRIRRHIRSTGSWNPDDIPRRCLR